MKTKILDVKGMTCGGCVNAVTKSLKARQGVSQVAVDLAKGKVSVEFDPVRSSVEELREAIEDAGFEVAESAAPPRSTGCCCSPDAAATQGANRHDKP